MKRFILTAAALMIAAAASLMGQDIPQLPLDPAVKIGKLENGMTYYIRANNKPENRAEFYLVTHVGAVQEAPDQDGLAHFLEHMCFNGTKNFPGKSLLDYLQSIGASFGGNINAATGMEQTYYMLNNIPLVRPGVVDTCLLIMHDYSHFVTCDPEEIDAERGVIIEEKRTRNTASWRSYMAMNSYLYRGSKLANTTLIGTQNQLETFRPESLTDFYHTWYRPDLQALIVVGAVDPETIELKIKEIFSDIPAVENPKQKETLSIEHNEEPIVGIITDPETRSTGIMATWKSEPLPVEYNNTTIGAVTEIVKNILDLALNERLYDISAKADAPFLGAQAASMQLCEATDNFLLQLGCTDGKEATLKAWQAGYTELEKMKRFGFTEDEYKRAKEKVLTSVENEANSADSRENADFIDEIADNFLSNSPLMEPAKKLEIVKQILPMLDVKTLNKAAQGLITDDNLVIIYQAPLKEGIEHPTEQDFIEVIKTVKASEIAAPGQGRVAKVLLDTKKVKGGKITTEEEGPYSSSVISLSNGVKVVLRPSDLEKNSITLDLTMQGGKTLIETEDLPSFDENVWTLYTQNTGVAKFSATDLDKILSGKTVSCNPYINGTNHGISASSTPKDFETALQLMYLTFTQPRFDEVEYEQGMSQIRAILPNLMTNPNYLMNIELTKTLYGNNPRRQTLNEEVLAKANIQTLEKVYKQLFKGASGATLYISGDFDPETVKPLVTKYIGALPKRKEATSIINRGDCIVDTPANNHFKVQMEAPKVSVYQVYKVNVPYTEQNAVAVSALSYILDMVYTKTLREEEGGTYGAGTYGVIRREPVEYMQFLVAFDTNEEQAPALIKLATKGIADIAENGPDAEYFSNTLKYYQKLIPENRIKNSYWVDNLRNWVKYGSDKDSEYEAAIANLTAEQIQEMASKIINEGIYFEIVMEPEK